MPAPIHTETSATLKVGQNSLLLSIPNCKKSTTDPKNTRSMKFPIAPPNRKPSAHCIHLLFWNLNEYQKMKIKAATVMRIRSVLWSDSIPKAAPVFLSCRILKNPGITAYPSPHLMFSRIIHLETTSSNNIGIETMTKGSIFFAY